MTKEGRRDALFLGLHSGNRVQKWGCGERRIFYVGGKRMGWDGKDDDQGVGGRRKADLRMMKRKGKEKRK